MSAKVGSPYSPDNWPRNGWLSDSEGNTANELEANQTARSRQGKYHRATWAGEVPAGTTYDFVIDVPTGMELYGISRDQTVGPGRLDIEFRVGGTWTTEDESIDGFNFDEVAGGISQSKLKRVSDHTGSALRASSFALNPSGNKSGSSASQTEAVLHPRFDETTVPVFRYSNPGTDPVELHINLVWEEREKQ